MLARGYLEGYYGRLLDWPERHQLLAHMHALNMTHYFYAPKEDVCHRLLWRQPYTERWHSEFAQFCAAAKSFDITVIAGIAPGLDFDFASLDQASSGLTDHNDFGRLCQKADLLLQAGAAELALLMDDIDPGFAQHQGEFKTEGVAHASLANRLAAKLDRDLLVVPRVYADEVGDETPDYLKNFCNELSTNHSIFYCGSHIVSQHITQASLAQSVGDRHAILVWDNLYANDYCPRRLFLGRFTGRAVNTNIFLNPTGLLHTDQLLLSVMQETICALSTTHDDDAAAQQAWYKALQQHGVPAEFEAVAEYFHLPAFAGRAASVSLPASAEQFEALEFLLWKWKTPLSREWYPYLMGLKQDLLLDAGNLPLDRVHKTQLPPLARQLAPLVTHPDST